MMAVSTANDREPGLPTRSPSAASAPTAIPYPHEVEEEGPGATTPFVTSRPSRWGGLDVWVQRPRGVADVPDEARAASEVVGLLLLVGHSSDRSRPEGAGVIRVLGGLTRAAGRCARPGPTLLNR